MVAAERSGSWMSDPGRRPVSLNTDRLVLRPLAAGDAAIIAWLARNPLIAEQCINTPRGLTQDQVMKWVEWQDAAMPDLDGEARTIARADSPGSILGMIGQEPDSPRRANIGYWLGAPYWGLGYATEAVQALVENIFDSESIEDVKADVRVGNAASRRVLEKCGFSCIGESRIRIAALERDVPAQEFLLTRSRWRGLKGQLSS